MGEDRKKHPEKYKIREKKYRQTEKYQEFINSSVYKLHNRLGAAVRNLKNGKGNSRTLQIIGADSYEHFIALMSVKIVQTLSL